MHLRKTHFLQIWPSLIYPLSSRTYIYHRAEIIVGVQYLFVNWVIENTHPVSLLIVGFQLLEKEDNIQKEQRDSNKIIICQPRNHSLCTHACGCVYGIVGVFVYMCLCVCREGWSSQLSGQSNYNTWASYRSKDNCQYEFNIY